MDPRIVHRKKVVAARAQREGERLAREMSAARALLARDRASPERTEADDVLDVVVERLAEDLARLEPRRGVGARLVRLLAPAVSGSRR